MPITLQKGPIFGLFSSVEESQLDRIAKTFPPAYDTDAFVDDVLERADNFREAKLFLETYARVVQSVHPFTQQPHSTIGSVYAPWHSQEHAGAEITFEPDIESIAKAFPDQIYSPLVVSKVDFGVGMGSWRTEVGVLAVNESLTHAEGRALEAREQFAGSNGQKQPPAVPPYIAVPREYFKVPIGVSFA